MHCGKTHVALTGFSDNPFAWTFSDDLSMHWLVYDRQALIAKTLVILSKMTEMTEALCILEMTEALMHYDICLSRKLQKVLDV